MQASAAKSKKQTGGIKRTLILTGLLVWSVCFFSAYLFLYHFWWLFVLSGTLLLACSYLIPKSADDNGLKLGQRLATVFNRRLLQIIAVVLVAIGLCFAVIS